MELLPLESIERARRRVAERAQRDEMSFGVRELNLTWTEEEPWKPWRLIDNFEFPEFQASTASMSGKKPCEMLLSKDSIFFCPRTNSLARLCVNASGDIVSDQAVAFQHPTLVVTLEEALREHVTDSLSWNPPSGEIRLASMTPTEHCVRAIDDALSGSLLERRDLFDAWFVHGDTGTGKTHFALVFAAIARMRWCMPTFYIDCKKLQSSSDLRMSSMLQELTAIFRQAMESQPSVLILDDLDFLVPNHRDGGIANGSSSQRQINPVAVDQTKLVANHLQSLMEYCVSKVIFFITCRSSASLPAEIAESLTCHTTVNIESLSLEERTELISSMLNGDTSDLVTLVSTLSDGYRPKDLRVIATRIKRAHAGTDDSKDFVQRIMDEYVPLSRQGLSVETGSEHQSWNDVGGIFAAKEKLKTTILNPNKYRKIYEKAPIKLPKGILLFGPPGCGKSFLVPALAKECGHTLITCRGPELLDRYIGASEANVRKLFERARSAAPAILFLDEFDALAPRRGSDNTGVTDRVVNQLLTYLDGVETTLENVFLIAATSRPEKIDPALLRPGRLEQHIYVGFPESSDEVIDILHRMMAQRQSASSILRSFQAGVLVLTSEESNHLAQLSPADIKAVLDSAHLEAIHEHLASCRMEPVVIQDHHFRKALLDTRASVSDQDRAMFAQVHQPLLAPSHTSYAKESQKGELKTSLM
jgi:peroxin-1